MEATNPNADLSTNPSVHPKDGLLFTTYKDTTVMSWYFCTPIIILSAAVKKE